MSFTAWNSMADHDSSSDQSDSNESPITENAFGEPSAAIAAVASDADFDDADDLDALENKRETPAWALSLAVHLGVILFLGGMTLDRALDQTVVIDSEMGELDPEELAFSEAEVETLGNQSDMEMVSPSQASAAHEGQEDPLEKIRDQLIETTVPYELPQTSIVEQPQRETLLDTVERTGSTEHPGGIEGSIDRLALEIDATLKQNKTLVVWVFDRSISVSRQREAIASRLENVYKQLGMREPTKDRALKTAVVAFGRTTEILTPEPLDDATSLGDLIRNIEPEKPGDIAKGDDKLENIFTAIGISANKWLHYRKGGGRRNVMIIAVTDEAGSDQELLEKTITLTKRYGIRCYVVGSAAPFGRREVEIPWEIDGEMYRMTLRPGPETILPELPRLPFWTVDESDLKYMSSGYGPYALTRLCAETGGLYLISQETRGPRFQPDAMRAYAPSDATVTEYMQDLKSHPIKLALVKTAENVKVEGIPRPQLNFRAESDTILQQQITEAQKPFAVFEYQLDTLARDLMAVENQRDTLVDPRWQAHFDLAMGRMLAMKARTLGYNATLAGMKVAPRSFETKGSNRWRLVPSPEISGGPQVRKLAGDAREYLTRVLDTHRGTPWALLAERELSQPMGWDWQEYKVSVARTGARRGNAAAGRRIRLAPEPQTNRPMQRPAARPKPPKKIKG